MPVYSSFLIVLGLCASLASIPGLANANAFLGQPQSPNVAALTAESERTLLIELEAALGSGHRHGTERRLKRIKQMLQPMFGAMAKNEYGRLGPAAGAYMLHRLFVQRHGWFVKGLEPAGKSMAAWNGSSPTVILEERVPDHVQELFEKRLGMHGLGVHELSVLASTLEHLVHTEALDRLNVSYRANKFSQEDVVSEDEAIKILDTYMSIYILGFMSKIDDVSTMTPSKAHDLHSKILEWYPAWPETQQFLREVYRSVAPKRDYLYFNEVETVVAEISERYGRFQDIECRQLKDTLVGIEDSSMGGSGRVRIPDFYKLAVDHGKWQFSESISYLRSMGALDESDSSNLRVIIPNYVSGPSNCVASSGHYSVCCLDECEGILGRLEQFVAAPEAPATQIAALIGNIPSASMPSNRTLSPWLLHRLDELDKHHNGRIPLHGRLFAQWMHYAYPRECTFPHVSGTIHPMRPEDLMANTSIVEADMSAPEGEMRHIVDSAPPLKHRVPGSEADANEESGMWSMDEELVVWRATAEPTQSLWKTLLEGPDVSSIGFRELALVGAVLSLSVALIQSLEPTLKALQNGKGSSEKYFV